MAPRLLIVDDNAELLKLLSSSFEEAGYQVLQVQRARAAMEKAKAERPDAAIVDVLLPDAMGYEVAAVLKALKIPFVLVSGVFKGGRHGLEATSYHGAADYFEKPFEVERLLERIVSLVPPEMKRAPAAEAKDEVEVEVDIEDESERELELTGRVSVTEAPHRVSATLSGERLVFQGSRPLPRIERRPPVPPEAQRALPPVLAPVESAASSRGGPLADNLPQLIAAFHLARETGELLLTRGPVRKMVFFERGAPVFASSNILSDRFGQFLVRIGKVPAEDLKAATLVAQRTKKRTGDVLIEMGLLNDSERMYYVGQQVKAIIYSLFAWEEGAFQLTFKKRAREETLKLDLHPANLILRGVKKLYSLERLVRLSPDEARPVPSPEPSFLLSDVELESWEASLLARVDGTKPVAELIRWAGKREGQVRGLLVGLIGLRILDLPGESGPG